MVSHDAEAKHLCEIYLGQPSDMFQQKILFHIAQDIAVQGRARHDVIDRLFFLLCKTQK